MKKIKIYLINYPPNIAAQIGWTYVTEDLVNIYPEIKCDEITETAIHLLYLLTSGSRLGVSGRCKISTAKVLFQGDKLYSVRLPRNLNTNGKWGTEINVLDMEEDEFLDHLDKIKKVLRYRAGQNTEFTIISKIIKKIRGK